MSGNSSISSLGTVLLAEDDPAHALLIRRAIEGLELPVRIDHVSDGASVLDYLLRRGTFSERPAAEAPCVVLLDLRMPKMDGLEVLAAIRADPGLDGIPVAILSSSDAERDVSRAYALNASSYLVKPLDFDEFTQMLGTVIPYWVRWNHYPPAVARSSGDA